MKTIKRAAEANSTERSSEGCQYIGGAHGGFCGAPVRPRTSYCEAHHKRVFVKAVDYKATAFQIDMSVNNPATEYARRAAVGRLQEYEDAG